jgi:isocitrate dehydrogenase
MMKVSDPVMFGHCVSVYFKDALEKHADVLSEIGANVNNGLADVSRSWTAARRQEGRDRGRHRRLLREPARPGHGRLAQGQDQPARAQRRDRRRLACPTWSATAARCGTRTTSCRTPSPWCPTAATPPCTGDHRRLPAARPVRPGHHGHRGQRRPDGQEGRGVRLSHDKTFMAPGAGKIRVVDAEGNVLLEQKVERAISSACARPRMSDPRLGEAGGDRARATGSPAVFWLDENRGHDAEIIKKVEQYLPEHDTDGLEILHHEARSRPCVHPRARPPRRGHHRRHRQRAA